MKSARLVAPFLFLGTMSAVFGCGPDDVKGLSESDGTSSRALPLSERPRAMTAVNKIETQKSGAAYVDECRDSGVPVPDTVIDVEAGWEFIGTAIAHPFMAPELDDARLWTFEDTEGICMALPRGAMGSNASVVGVICMGWNGNTCYFTNEIGTTFSPITAIPIGDLVGGTDLEDAPEGPCSDCHAGENPFIVHPNDPAFGAALGSVTRYFPDVWPTPIVPDAFPGNPEPLDQLGPVSEGQLKCDMCHRQGGAGRFPLPSTDYPLFCSQVLALAVGEDPMILGTMPPNGLDVAQYGDHIGWLTAACGVAPGGGVVVPFLPPHVTILPPDVEPPYACSKYVHVTSAMYGATVKLYKNNVLQATGVFRDTHGGLVLKAGSAFTVGQALEVSQTVGATTSVRTLVLARDYTEDYPDGLPAPFISPHPLYECASAIAVFNVPGVELTTTKTPPVGAAKSYTLSTGAGHTWIAGLGSPPFEIGTRLKVRQKLCMETSPDSSELPAGGAPAFLPELRFEPAQLTVGQPIVRFASIWQGSSVTLMETNGPIVVYNNASVPYNDWFVDVTTSLGGPVQATHDIVPIQTLCGVQSGDPDSPPPRPCNEETIVPAIAPPFAGDDFVLITYGVPGANTRVFDGVPTELGNGAGNVVGLSRELVAGEVINIAATLGACSVNRAFSIVVSG